jgi:hypothetical protein
VARIPCVGVQSGSEDTFVPTTEGRGESRHADLSSVNRTKLTKSELGDVDVI